MTTVKAKEKDLTVNGVRLRYLDWGTEGRTPLVCLHSHTAQAHIWDEFAEAVSSQYHVLAIDQRGHGESEWAETGYDRDRFVEDLAAFVDSLDLKRFVLVGGSMGGWNSLLYTMNHPDRVERIVLVDIAPESSAESLTMRETRPPTPMEFRSLEAAVEWTRQGNPWASDAQLRKDTEFKMRQRDDGQWTWKADPGLFGIWGPNMTDRALIDRYWKAVETIACPIMEVRGAESILVSDETVERMKRVGKEVSSVDVAGAGHVVSVDKPQEFIEATRSFLGVPA